MIMSVCIFKGNGQARPGLPRPGFQLSLGDLGDQKNFYQWNSEKRK